MRTLEQLQVVVPPLEEQAVIARFLDKRCSDIDEDIARRREVIDKLKEYKKSLIAHAVTKGLDPTAEMKDSGVEWLGAVPASWEVKKLKYALVRNDGGVWGDDPKEDAENCVVLRSTEQTIDGLWDIKSPAERYLGSLASIQRCRLEPNDLLITKSSGSSDHIGKTTLFEADTYDKPCWYSNFMQRLTPSKTVEPKYLWYVLNSSFVREQFVYLQESSISMGNLTKSIIDSVVLALPPSHEQRGIVSYLDDRCAAINEAIARQEQLIDKLDEYRKSIIHHAVTGKIDCTEG